MPSRSTIRIAMMIVRVRRAFATTGSRNACTPLLTASTPVIAVQPLANARNSNLGERRRRNHGLRMPARGNCREHAPGHRRAQAHYEDAGRQQEQRARRAHSAQIHKGQQNQNDQT